MNYDKPELLDRLAREYVVGTLHGQARRRFERVLSESYSARYAVWRWEQRLSAISETADDVKPPERAWELIAARLWAATARPKNYARTLTLWRSLAGLMATLSLCLAIFLPLETDPPEQKYAPDHVAFVGEESAPLWIISADLQSGQLQARAINAEAASVDKVFELWMLPEEGAPQSIGLMPVSGDSVAIDMPHGLLALLRASKGLAISVEPIGGSPTGLPTGPVVHTANIRSL